MLTSECSSSRKPEDAEKRFALARVAAKLLSGEQENIEKWKCFEELSPQDEGAPKTLRQMEDYILSFVGCVNISAEEKTVYYNEKRHTMNFATSGDDFGKLYLYEFLNKLFISFKRNEYNKYYIIFLF